MDPRLIKLCTQHTQPQEIHGKTIIDVGSYDVNGSFRQVLGPMQPAKYIGVDIAAGPGVDDVCSVEDVIKKYGKESFDVVVSTEMIEHVQNWRIAINNIKDLCKMGGLLYLTSRSKGFGYHGFPADHWRYELDDVRLIFANWQIDVLVEEPGNYGFFLKAHKTVRDLLSLDAIALYNIMTDRRWAWDAAKDGPGAIRRMITEDELTDKERNP